MINFGREQVDQSKTNTRWINWFKNLIPDYMELQQEIVVEFNPYNQGYAVNYT